MLSSAAIVHNLEVVEGDKRLMYSKNVNANMYNPEIVEVTWSLKIRIRWAPARHMVVLC